MTTAKHYDAIVVGVGGMGSAAVYELAKRGRKVLGLERYDIPNSMGSSHGLTRIIRMAYMEDPAYVPLLRRAYELWHETQARAGEQLLHITGGVDASAPQDDVFKGSLLACETFGLAHEVYTPAELSKRFPAFHLPTGMMANYQPDAGFLLSERCIVAHVDLAMTRGAAVHGREQVLEWEPSGDGVKVRTDRGTYRADQLVITAGAWAEKLLAPLRQGLAVPERQVLAWLQPRQPELFRTGNLPVWVIQGPEGVYYGFPVWGIPGFKLGRMHHRGETIDPDRMDRQCHPEDEAVLRSFAERYFPEATGPTLSLKACIFTNTPDEHFIVDRHPDHPQVVFGAGFSGHGFKFTGVIGEILAELAVDGTTRHDIGFLRLGRFTSAATQGSRPGCVAPPSGEGLI